MRLLRRARSERGQAMVEFALLTPLLLMLVIGVIQFAVALNFWFDLQRLANQGARSASVNCGMSAQTPAPQCGTTTLANYLSSRNSSNPDGQVVSSGNNPSVEICYIVPATADPNSYKASPGDSVRVTLKDRYRLQWIVNLAKIDLSARATMRLEEKPNNWASSGALPDPGNSANWILSSHTGNQACQP